MSYLAELENKRLGAKEMMAEYVSDIKGLVTKGYPTVVHNKSQVFFKGPG